ncbi:MAG: signal peptide peptidase SppA [Cytophagales bacterium]|nr:MAG: signal peptide peptidase SppA [Cytophagales bacterium]
MLGFLKNVLSTIVGLALFLFVIVFTGIAILMSAMPEEKEKVKSTSVLRLKLDAPIVERDPDNFLSKFSPFSGVEPSIGLIELKELITKAKSDSSIKGIFLDISMVNAGYATLQELRNKLIDFKSSQKFIVAYGEFYNEKSYYLASIADKIYLPPSGNLEFNGLESEIMFLKGALEKLEIKAEIFKVGEFKSAVEPLFLDKMSDASRTQTRSFLNAINNNCLSEIALSRNIPLEQLQKISDSMLVRSAHNALELGLITDLAYYDNLEQYIQEKLKISSDEEINFISYSTYKNSILNQPQNTAADNNKIAVIIANGEINTGKSDDASIGSESLCEQIRKARKDENVKAIVLRINSPGGSALASDVIWREVTLTKKIKPIVASMSDLAASGGYYIAMACDTIIAQPNTITGSIGVFGISFNAESFLKNKLGVSTDRVNTGQFSDLGTITRPMTTFEKQIIQKEVENIYESFTSKAAEGRRMTLEKLKSIASGRVWAGSEGKNNGLVDIYGGLDEAIQIAANMASTSDYQLLYLPERKNQYWNQLINQIGNEEEALSKQLGIFYPYLKNIRNVKKLEGIQARMPFEIYLK